MAIASVVCNISMQSLVLSMCHQGVHLWHKRQREVTMTTDFGTKIDINAFLSETTGMGLLITGSFRGQPISGRHF